MKPEEKKTEQKPSYLREVEEFQWDPAQEFGGVSTREFVHSVAKVSAYVKALTEDEDEERFAHFAVLGAIRAEEIRAEVTKMRQRVQSLVARNQKPQRKTRQTDTPRRVRRAEMRMRKAKMKLN